MLEGTAKYGFWLDGTQFKHLVRSGMKLSIASKNAIVEYSQQ